MTDSWAPPLPSLGPTAAKSSAADVEEEARGLQLLWSDDDDAEVAWCDWSRKAEEETASEELCFIAVVVVVRVWPCF